MKFLKTRSIFLNEIDGLILEAEGDINKTQMCSDDIFMDFFEKLKNNDKLILLKIRYLKDHNDYIIIHIKTKDMPNIIDYIGVTITNVGLFYMIPKIKTVTDGSLERIVTSSFSMALNSKKHKSGISYDNNMLTLDEMMILLENLNYKDYIKHKDYLKVISDNIVNKRNNISFIKFWSSVYYDTDNFEMILKLCTEEALTKREQAIYQERFKQFIMNMPFTKKIYQFIKDNIFEKIKNDPSKISIYMKFFKNNRVYKKILDDNFKHLGNNFGFFD